MASLHRAIICYGDGTAAGQRGSMAARRASRGSNLQKMVVVVVVMVMMVACKGQLGEATYDKTLRHQYFGKYHTSHHNMPSSTTPSPSHSTPPPNPAYIPHITTPASHGTSLAVEGVVACLNCKYAPVGSLQQSTPLPGAKVRLACRDMRFKTFVYETTVTDEHGYFLFLMKDFQYKRHKGVRGCRVVLISSPDPSCARVTNINYGRVGSPLIAREKVYEREILYSVGPFAFAPSPSSCYKH
ncbi:hypothetical protein L7F22_061487 [Adiantum nelumboides]|nr:hypothetical protein [Adiantum nelumboides]